MHSSEYLHNKSIADLVSENHVLAGVLHYFGICFFQHERHSLVEACQAHKVNPSQVMAALEEWASRKEPTREDLYLHPIELVVGYLKTKHRYFVRQALPFLSSMVEGIDLGPGHRNLMTDLRLMFPLFVDDFIHHIHEEEDTLFRRISLLQNIDASLLPQTEAIEVFALPSIAIMASDHEAHDDEMEGIRNLTNDYRIPASATVSMKVLFHELQQLEKELIIHAKIENELLFPKAIELEKEVKRKLTLQIKSN